MIVPDRKRVGQLLSGIEISGKRYTIATGPVGRTGQSHKKRNVEMIGGGGAVGAAIGAIAGGGKGAAIGAAIGAAAAPAPERLLRLPLARKTLPSHQKRR